MDHFHLTHFIVGFCIAALSLRWPAFALLALAAGPLKELADLTDYDTTTNPDWIDLLCTWAGATAGWLAAALVRTLRRIAAALVRIDHRANRV